MVVSGFLTLEELDVPQQTEMDALLDLTIPQDVLDDPEALGKYVMANMSSLTLAHLPAVFFTVESLGEKIEASKILVGDQRAKRILLKSNLWLDVTPKEFFLRVHPQN